MKLGLWFQWVYCTLGFACVWFESPSLFPVCFKRFPDSWRQRGGVQRRSLSTMVQESSRTSSWYLCLLPAFQHRSVANSFWNSWLISFILQSWWFRATTVIVLNKACASVVLQSKVTVRMAPPSVQKCTQIKTVRHWHSQNLWGDSKEPCTLSNAQIYGTHLVFCRCF